MLGLSFYVHNYIIHIIKVWNKTFKIPYFHYNVVLCEYSRGTAISAAILERKNITLLKFLEA